LHFPNVAAHCDRHAHWCHVVTLDPQHARRDAASVARMLADQGIETRRLYHPLHLHPPYAYGGAPLPRCEAFATRGLVLPSGNATSLEEIERVCEAMRGLLL
jgi:dTDP-4-amino-4,6-dideoxygalactose transaminase